MFYNKNNLPLGSGYVVIGLWKWRLINIKDIINAVQASSKLNEIINKMDAVTTYADKLGLYEYILNRVEYRFNECEFDNNYYKNNYSKKREKGSHREWLPFEGEL